METPSQGMMIMIMMMKEKIKNYNKNIIAKIYGFINTFRPEEKVKIIATECFSTLHFYKVSVLTYSKINMKFYNFGLWVECSPMDQETGINPRSCRIKNFKMVLDTSLLNTQQYKVNWSNPGKGVAPSPTLGVVAIEKGAFWSPSTMIATFTYLPIGTLYFFLYI